MIEFLVTMTTHVPDGTPPHQVDDVRAREAAHTRELAAQGRVLRLWRPPLGPGEWRTIGLFAAEDSDDLIRTLASMPLSIWRTDDPTRLAGHPNDPGRDRVPIQSDADEYLVSFTLDVSSGTSRQTVDDADSREAARARELADDGHLIRLWTLARRGRAVGLWQASRAEDMRSILASLPLAPWLTVETLRLTRHPSDPATVRHSRASIGASSLSTGPR